MKEWEMKKLGKGALLLLMPWLLASCASVGTPAGNWQEQNRVSDFNADGRLAVKVNEQGSYANFDWRYQNGVQTIDVNTPLGNTVGQLCQDKLGVLAVDSSGRRLVADSAGELSRQLLGYDIPLQYLYVWAAGQRVKEAAYQVDKEGRLNQMGWTISRTEDEAGKVKTLLLESKDLTLRLVFDNMQALAEDAAAPQQCAARVEQ